MKNIRILGVGLGVFIGTFLLILAGCGYQDSSSPSSDDLTVVEQQLPSEADGDRDRNQRGEGNHKDCQYSGKENASDTGKLNSNSNGAIKRCHGEHVEEPIEEPIRLPREKQ